MIAGLKYDEFVRLVAPHTRTIGQRDRLKTIWKKAADSIGCNAGESLEFEAKVMVEGLKHVQETISEVSDKIEEICCEFPEYRYLLTIPGFGPDVSSKTLGAIGDPFRFKTGKQILKMAGLDLSAERSGKNSDAAIPVISKKGKADLRYALYQATMIASTRNKHFITYYTNKLRGREKEKGIRAKMRVKLAYS